MICHRGLACYPWTGLKTLTRTRGCVVVTCPIPRPIQVRTVEPAPTTAVVALDVFFGWMPLRRGRHVLAEPGQLLFNRLRLRVMGGRDTDIRGYFQGISRMGAVAQNTGVHSCLSPMAVERRLLADARSVTAGTN
jgi:hypothetical protein